MKYKKIFAAIAAAALCCLTGCSGDFIDELLATEEAGNAFTAEAVVEQDSPDSGNAAGTVEISAENVGTGLEQLVITGELDEDPNREIVRQIRGIDVNGNTLSDEFYFYRSTLSGTNKQAYDQIYAALYNGVQSVNLSVSVSTADICDVVYSVYYDHPELFWVDSSLSYSYNYSNVVTFVTVNFNGTANDLSGSQQRFESAIAPLLSTARTLSNDADKVKLVHDYLTNTIDYTYIDDWSDEDWDNYWNDLDGWLDENGYDDIDYNNFDDWNNYYYGDDWNDYYDYDYDYDSDDWYNEYDWLYGY